jgi:cobalt-zinc-cadmium efflux system outer membrane protein
MMHLSPVDRRLLHYTGDPPRASRALVHPSVVLTMLAILSTVAGPVRAAAQNPDISRAALGAMPRAAPLTLEQVLRATLIQHPLLDAAQARVRAAAGARTTAGVLGNPVLAYQLENTRLPGGEPVGMPREAMTTATFPLEVFYQRGPRMRRADAEVRAAVADAATDRQRLALDAAHAYYRLALAQEQVAAAHDLAAWLDTLVAYNQTRAREGVAAEADLLRSQLERDRARADLTGDEVDRARAQADLTAFVSDSDGALAPVVVVAPPAPLRLPTVAAVGPGSAAGDAPGRATGRFGAVGSDSTTIAGALAGRPEMQAAQERVAAAGANIAAEHRLLLRQLGAMVGAKQSGGTTSLLLGASVPLPLFDRNRGDVARARAERDARTAELAAVARTIRAEVTGADAAARLLTVRAEELTYGTPADTGSYLARADEARRIALGAYREGAVSLLQVLDAARAWGEARLTFYRTLYAQHESVLAALVARGADLLTSLPSTAPQRAPGDQPR